MIYTLTLNPAVDHLIYLPSMQMGVTNRVQQISKSVGGKGTHVSMNLRIMDTPSIALGLAHGRNGQYIINELKNYGVEVDFFYSPQRESRNCYIVIETDSGRSTTVAEQGLPLSKEEESWVFDSVLKYVQKDDWFVLAGDASNINSNLLSTLMELLQRKEVRLVLDTSGQTLRSGLRFQPYLIKPNRDELSKLCGFPIESDDDVLRSFLQLEKYNIEIIAVSLGAEGSIVRTPTSIYKAVPPKVSVNNSAGCGDAFLSGLVYASSLGIPLKEGLKIATSISAATANHELSVGFDPSFAEKIKGDCQVIRLQ